MSYYVTNHDVSSADSVALEDSIMQKGYPAMAGSKILEGFKAPFDAEVVTRLAAKNITIAGKTRMSEFGIASVSPDRPDKTSGGVEAVAGGAVKYALCNDVFGINRRQAAEAGVCCIHPTYGTVSRYGLIPLASSMDQIGVVCGDLSEGFGLLSLIAGKDEKDGAMFPDEKYSYTKSDNKITVGLPEAVVNQANEGAQKSIRELAEKLGFVNISLSHFEVYRQVMYILCCAEISNNINRYDGIKFGYRTENYTNLEELYVNTRNEGFGLGAKLAAVMGSMVLSQDEYEPYYDRSMKIRRLIKESVNFDGYDVIILPIAISDDPYVNLSLYSLAPLAGLPSVSFQYQGQGIQLVANVRNESALLTAWEGVKQ